MHQDTTGREVWGGGTSGKVWRGVATITLFVCYLCIAKVEVDGCGMANMEHAIWFRRESSHHLDWTNRVTELWYHTNRQYSTMVLTNQIATQQLYRMCKPLNYQLLIIMDYNISTYNIRYCRKVVMKTGSRSGLGSLYYIPFPLFPGGAVSAAWQSMEWQCSPRTGGSLLHTIQEVGVVNHDVQPKPIPPQCGDRKL